VAAATLAAMVVASTVRASTRGVAANLSGGCAAAAVTAVSAAAVTLTVQSTVGAPYSYRQLW
jgi:hypothetical protein